MQQYCHDQQILLDTVSKPGREMEWQKGVGKMQGKGGGPVLSDRKEQELCTLSGVDGGQVAVAAQLRDFALGSDTAGSVRIPASYCGTYGVRPTHGRVSLENACALAPSYDTGGWFATSANVLCKVGQVLLCPSTRKDVKFRRWLVAKDAFDTADSETSTALYNVVAAKLEVVKRLLGVPQEVVVADLPGLCGLQAWADVFRSNQTVEVWQTLGPWIQENDWPECAPAIKERLKFASTFPQSQVPESTKARERITQHMGELLRDDGLLMLPTAPGPAPERGAADADPELRFKVLRLTSIAGLAGLPQVSLPLAHVRGCPVGLSLVGPQGSDEALLQLSMKLDEVLVPK
eukprot:jgi/Botrbrau1/7162/Bobra.0143s0032.3